MKENILRVLLVEDDEDDYILTSELLKDVKETEYEISWVSRFDDGLAAVLADNHDVCLIDYRLGDKTGIELIRAAIAAGCRLPMVLSTSTRASNVTGLTTKEFTPRS